ncbi:restriction endonuclease subunit S [Methyloversatilis discipulorum]|uniref:restriction endonuclease subunit S n=1 Tax=Methyloversatilis discipulorum TaxID=1119528 RepID=UPI003F3EC4CF
MTSVARKTSGWREVHLADVVDQDSPICYGIVLPGDHVDDGVPVIKVKDIAQGGVRTIGLLQTSPDIDAKYKRSRLAGGDILLSIRGTVGRLGFVPDELTGANITQDTARIRISCSETRAYVYQALQSDDLQVQIRDHVVGQAVKGINIRDVKRLKLLLPIERHAQKYIAELLRTQDTAIQKIEQLIAAKERHYFGLVGRLITGRSKSEPSRHVSIRDIADRVQRQGDGGDYPLLTISSASGFIRQEDRYSRYMAGESAKTYTLLRAGEFSYNKGNSKRYEFGCVFQLQNYEAALVPSVYVSFRLHETVCAAYMRHLFVADYLKPQLRALVKTGVRNNGLLNISPDEFLSTTVPLPPLDQQSQIAKVLDAADANIDLLKQQLAALRTQKRGLMQKLLTGQWRLPIPKENEVPVNG